MLDSGMNILHNMYAKTTKWNVGLSTSSATHKIYDTHMKFYDMQNCACLLSWCDWVYDESWLLS